MGLVRARGDHPTGPAGMGQCPQQHVADTAPRGAPPLEPVPLNLLTRWVGDLDRVPLTDTVTRLAVRTQSANAQLAHEARIAPPIAQRHHLVEQRRGPHMRIIDEAGLQVRDEPFQRIGPGPPSHTGLAALHVRLDRAPITTDMPTDRAVRPASVPECVNFHVFSLCEHEPRGSPPRLNGLDTVSRTGAPDSLVDPLVHPPTRTQGPTSSVIDFLHSYVILNTPTSIWQRCARSPTPST